MLFIVFISIALFFLFFAVCFTSSIIWLPKKDVVSVCYCVPAKTPAMGVPLANTIFLGMSPVLEAKIQIPMVIYQGLQIVAGSLLTMAFRHWVAKDEERRKSDEESQHVENQNNPRDSPRR
jgi:solute carrier family 10 (sodium/bile acid cotransporter), member 7